MLRSMKELYGYKMHAIDGEIGKAHEFYFDDQFWLIRYLVVNTGNWLPARLVLISPFSLGQPDWSARLFPVNETKEQVKNSPEIDIAVPVARQHEIALAKYYNWPRYWTGNAAEIPGAFVIPLKQETNIEEEQDIEENEGDPHLRSSREVIGYNIEASDGEIGHLEDFIIEDESWIIRYMIVDTRKWLHWLPGGKKVLIAPTWIDRIDWAEATVYVDLTRDQVKDSPEFDPSTPVNREYEVLLHDYYGRPKYWTKV
jgi:hypothetical protein